jgi:hypothetical protein
MFQRAPIASELPTGRADQQRDIVYSPTRVQLGFLFSLSCKRSRPGPRRIGVKPQQNRDLHFHDDFAHTFPCATATGGHNARMVCRQVELEDRS